MTYPVSVIVPALYSRRAFFSDRCLPSIEENDPAEVIVVYGPGNGNEKRNKGARAATQEYLLFVDDDSRLMKNAIAQLLNAMYGDAAFTFGGYRYNDPTGKLPPDEVYPGKWSPERIRAGNYIDTTSLIRRDAFPCFDPKIERFQDWDLWLTMETLGYRGNYVPFCVVEKFVIDQRVSDRIPIEEARAAVMRKHGL